MNFEWHPTKAEANFQKHGVTFEEASTVFRDPFSTNFPDADHSIEEERFIIIGVSSLNRLLVVAHTERVNQIRII
ncbi:BrnT family toxin [Leptolyngbyaceae cyanobacterium UHCC 1019]